MVKRVSKKQSSSQSTEVAFALNLPEEGSTSPPSKKTVILFGNPRGGTTMIANVVRSMGICLGDDLPVNLEDNEFNWDVLGRLDPEPTRAQKLASIQQAIRDRNSRHDVWGWKYPRIDCYFKDVIEEIENPMLVCVFRDIIASTWRGVVRRNQAPENALRRALELQTNNLGLIQKSGLPSLLVSYEKAIADPQQLASSLNQFLGLGLSDAELSDHAKRVNPELGYQASQV